MDGLLFSTLEKLITSWGKIKGDYLPKMQLSLKGNKLTNKKSKQ